MPAAASQSGDGQVEPQVAHLELQMKCLPPPFKLPPAPRCARHRATRSSCCCSASTHCPIATPVEANVPGAGGVRNAPTTIGCPPPTLAHTCSNCRCRRRRRHCRSSKGNFREAKSSMPSVPCLMTPVPLSPLSSPPLLPPEPQREDPPAGENHCCRRYRRCCRRGCRKAASAADGKGGHIIVVTITGG